MFEDHIVLFLKMWRVGCGFLGEQDAESLHASMNSTRVHYNNVRNETDSLAYLMNPEARKLKVEKAERGLKQNAVDNLYIWQMFSWISPGFGILGKKKASC